MKKKIIAFMTVLALGTAAITGCGDSAASNKDNIMNKKENNAGSSGQEYNTSNANTENNINSAEGRDDRGSENITGMLENADVTATVVEFSESGCKVIQGENTKDEARQAAAGNDGSEGNQITVVYGDNVKFQLATASAGDSDATLEDSDKSELKKQSNIYLFGTYQEDGTFLADKVIIYRTLR